VSAYYAEKTAKVLQPHALLVGEPEPEPDLRPEILGGYLWSPKRNGNGARNPFYESMREVARAASDIPFIEDFSNGPDGFTVVSMFRMEQQFTPVPRLPQHVLRPSPT
jgi:hypothetical protein